MAAPPPASGAPATFDLPEVLLEVLPTDPFEQLDVARKITSIALASRVSKLESEASRLRQHLSEKDVLIAELRAQVDTLDATLGDISNLLVRTADEKETLLSENASLSNTVKKLNRDVSKLEIFKKTLMQSLQEDEENPQAGAPKVTQKVITNAYNFSSGSLLGEEDASLSPSKSTAQTQFSETGSSVSEDSGYSEINAIKQGTRSLRLASHSSTPRLTPPDSPPRLSAGGSPKRLSKTVSPSPRRHSVSVATNRNTFEDRQSIYSSLPSSYQSSMTSPFDAGSQTGRTRVDGKEFFRQVRSRLSYEQFSAFLANVKELNAHKQTREETLRMADEIFGPNNKDLYNIFEGLIARNLH